MKKIVIVEIGALRIFTVLLQLVFLKIYTSHTAIYELGFYYFLFTVSYSLNAFLLVPLDYFQQSQLYNLKENCYSLKSFLDINNIVFKITSVLLIVGIIICYFINTTIIKFIPIIVSLSLSTYFVTLLRGFINNLEKRRMAIYTLLVEGVLKIFFYLIYIKFFKASALLILISLLSASVITAMVLIFKITSFSEYKREELTKFTTSEIFKFTYPISIGAVINWIQLQGYRMILVPLGLVEIVGVYGTVANVGTSGMSAFSTVYTQLFVPDLYKTQGSYLKKYLIYAFFSILIVLTVGLMFSKFIIALLTKAVFVKYSSLIAYGILSEAGNFLIGALTIYLTIKKLTKTTLKASITGLVVFSLSFGLLFIMGKINVYTIGLPIVFTQMIITVYLSVIVYQSKKKEYGIS